MIVMNLGDAHGVLVGLTKTDDNARYFNMTYRKWYSPTDLLSVYLTFIKDNCDAWFRGLPDKLTSEKGLSKPKSGILKLIKEKSVIAAVGGGLCTEVEYELNKTWREKKDIYIGSRNTEVAVAVMEDSESDVVVDVVVDGVKDGGDDKTDILRLKVMNLCLEKENARLWSLIEVMAKRV